MCAALRIIVRVRSVKDTRTDSPFGLLAVGCRAPAHPENDGLDR